MNRSRVSLLALVSALLFAALAPAAARAETQFTYRVFLSNPSAQHSGYATVARINPSQFTSVRLIRNGNLVSRSDTPSNAAFATAYVFGEIQSGDSIEVYQSDSPQPEPPVVPPTETYVVPHVTVRAKVGSKIVSGDAPDNTAAVAGLVPGCPYEDFDGDALAAKRTTGTYSAKFGRKARPGDMASGVITETDGDRVTSYLRVPGDPSCLSVDATSRLRGDNGSGDTADKPYRLIADDLDTVAVPTSRIALTRKGATVASGNDAADLVQLALLSLAPTQKPHAGDEVQLFRPADATTPSAKWTIPKISGVFDPTTERVSVKAPQSSLLEVSSCRLVTCAGLNFRDMRNAHTGTTLFDFTHSQGYEPAMDLRPSDQVIVTWVSNNKRFDVSVDLVRGKVARGE